MVVQAGTTVTEGSIDGTLTKRGALRGGSALFLADRWFDFEDDIDLDVDFESVDGLASAVLEYVKENKPTLVNSDPGPEPKLSMGEPSRDDYVLEGSEEEKAEAKEAQNTALGWGFGVAVIITWIGDFGAGLFWGLVVGLVIFFRMYRKRRSSDPEQDYQNDLLQYRKEMKKYAQKVIAYESKKNAYLHDELRVRREYRDLWHDTKLCSRCAHIYR